MQRVATGRRGRRGDASLYRERGVDVRCPACGGSYPPQALRVRSGARRGVAICQWCYVINGPDGGLRG